MTKNTKLDAELKQLKLKLAKTSKALVEANYQLKKQALSFKQELANQLSMASELAREKAHQDMEKRQEAHDKVVAAAIAKFEKSQPKTTKGKPKRAKPKKVTKTQSKRVKLSKQIMTSPDHAL